jgi:hypothetical protein
MQIKTTLKFHLTPVRITINKNTINMCWLQCGKKMLAIRLLGIYSKECDTGYSRGTCTPVFIAALFTIDKLWKQPKCPLLKNRLRKYDIYTQWNFTQP